MQAGELGESSRNRPTEEYIHTMVLQMEQQMFVIRKTITSFDENSGEINHPIHFQGSTRFLSIIKSPLAMEIPTGGTKTQSQPTVPKPEKKRVVRNPTANKTKTTPAIHIVDPTYEVRQSLSASLIF